MVQDPFLARETEKYGSPIPSREYILLLLAKLKKPINREKLAKKLNLTTADEIKALRLRLRAMERDGQLLFTRKQCFLLPEMATAVEGVVIGHRDGFGFLRVKGRTDDLYLSASEFKKGIIHGDSVQAQASPPNTKGRSEAHIIKIISPQNTAIIGRYVISDTEDAVVLPTDNRFNFVIAIGTHQTLTVNNSDIVIVELLKRPTAHNSAYGNIIKVLGNQIDMQLATEVALRSHAIPSEWPQTVTEEIKSCHGPDQNSLKKRVDLRQLPLITIDGEDSRDFDDAVYCEKKRGGGWRLWVAIADVSYYVRPGSALDIEAYDRGNSVYFPNFVVPMLPHVLSNDLCSLNPQQDRLALICEMTISQKGRLSTYQFYEAVINSKARLTYTKAWQIIQGDTAVQSAYPQAKENLLILHDLYKMLDNARIERGGITFDTEEPKFIFNEASRIERIDLVIRNDAHKLIEESMILANVAAAKFLQKHEEPGLFRVHDTPSPENVTALRTVLSKLSLVLPGEKKPIPKDYSQLTESIANRPDKGMLQTMILRSMKPAVYDAENRGHFGLALKSYTHFTSPIRRYPDLIVHRAIKHVLSKQKSKHATENSTGQWHYELEQLFQYGEHCSVTERRADEATRDVNDWLKCDFMRDHIGTTFHGVISNVVSFGFFVRLVDLFIDGLVHITNLPNDNYYFDSVDQYLIGERTGKRYRLGDKIEIRVASVNVDQRKIDFVLLEKNGGNAKGKQKTDSLSANSKNKMLSGQQKSEFKSSKKRRIKK